MPRGPQEAALLFRELFAAHSAHIAMLDADGVIIAVNDAWTAFGRENGVDERFQFRDCDYLEVCHRAAVMKSAYAQEAMLGLLRVLKSMQQSFSMVYPCHSPTEPRWFRM